MKLIIICYVLGLLSTLYLHQLPNRLSIFLFSIIIFSLYIVFKLTRLNIFKYFIAFGLGFCWMLIYVHQAMVWSLPKEVEGKTISITGFVASIPNQTEQVVSFDFYLEILQNQKINQKIHLSWDKPNQELKVGDRWALRVKLKRFHALRNPGGFDLEKSALQNHVRAHGYVLASNLNKKLSHCTWCYPITFIRQTIENRLKASIQTQATKSIILALTLGDTSLITQDQWQVFRNTGTSHLVAISGLHIGLVAGFFAKLGSFLWRRTPLVLLIPAPPIGAMIGIFVALVYSALAGFSISTQRSLIMLILGSMAYLLHRFISITQIFIVTLGVILLVDPLGILSYGFWLSFIAVGLLIYGSLSRDNSKNILSWLKPQYVVAVGMMPITLFYFQRTSFISPLANLIAIPWFSFLVVPFCLIGTLCLFLWDKLGIGLLLFSAYSLKIIWWFLHYLAHLPHIILQHAIGSVEIMILATMACLIFLAPAGLPNRWLGLFWIMPLFLLSASSLLPNQAQLALLDVGQGLAAVIRTKSHTLIYDTGAKFNQHDMGELVLIPFLNQEHIRSIDMLIISHGDNDHIGGAGSLLQQNQVSLIFTSVPERFKSYTSVYFCEKGMKWRWDGVDFEFLHPAIKEGWRGNNASCVLKVIAGKQSILLTGDIEKSAEKRLLQSPSKLRSTILIAPHHGSRTSSSVKFIRAVSPRYVLFPCGYLNRYHHPSQIVCSRYIDQSAKLLDTVASGAIIMTLGSGSDIVWHEYRKKYRKFWHIF